MKIGQFFRYHLGAFLSVAVLVVIFTFPYVVFRTTLGSDYQGIPLTGADADLHYFAQMVRSASGFGLSNPYIKEGVGMLTGFVAPLHGVLAVPLRLGVSLEALDLLYKTIFPALAFLLLYAFTFSFTKDRLWSVVGGMLVLLGYGLFQSQDISNIFHGFPSATEFLRFSRPVNPQVTSLIFFAALYFAYEYIKKPNWSGGLILALLLGISFYSYLYLWIVLVIFFGVLLFVFLYLKEWPAVNGMVGTLFLGFVIGIPAHLMLYRYLVDPLRIGLRDVQPSLLLESSHMPTFTLVGAVALFFYYRVWKFSLPQERIFWGSLLGAIFLTVNQNVITGFFIQPGHFHWYYGMPIYTLLVTFALQRLSDKLPRFPRVLLPVALIAASMGMGLSVQFFSYVAHRESSREVQHYMPVLRWLKENTPPKTVVLANNAFSDYLPIYTKNYAVWSSYAETFLLPLERRTWRPETIIGENFDTESRRFELEYVVWDRVRDPDWIHRLGAMKTVVFENERFTVFALK